MILPHPSAPEGAVLRPSSYIPADFTPPCAILCRNTAPLVSFAYSLLHRNIRCCVRGKEIGEQLAALVRKLHATDVADFVMKLGAWRATELQKCELQNASPERVSDQYQCLMFFVRDVGVTSTIPALLSKISALFDDHSPASTVLLSTIHRAKGLEWPTVFLLDFDKYLPSKYATHPWQRRQERNLAYVAITRSMDKLVYISSDKWKE